MGAALSASTVTRGQTVRVRGTVTPNHRNQTVYLQRLDGSSWRTIGTVRLSSSSGYPFSVRVTARGSWRYRVVKPADGDHVIGTSGMLSLRVR